MICTCSKGKQPLLTPFLFARNIVTSSSSSSSVFMSQLNLMQLNLYPLPYTTSQPPQELVHDIQTVSGHSDTAAFDMGLDNRDVFLGMCRCVICGHGSTGLQRCHIVDPSDISMVRRMCSRTDVWTTYHLFSGHCSDSWDGPQVSKSHLGMKPVMA